MMQRGVRAAFLVLFCILLAILFYYKAFLSPLQGDILTRERDITALQPTMTFIHNKTEDLDKLNTRLSELELQIRNRKTNLPEVLDPYDIILLLSGIEQGTLTKNSLIFLDPIERQDFDLIPVRFHFSSDYNGFLKLLSFLDSLETRPSISNMQISAAPSGEKMQNAMDDSGKVIYNLDVEMTLNFYMRRN